MINWSVLHLDRNMPTEPDVTSVLIVTKQSFESSESSEL